MHHIHIRPPWHIDDPLTPESVYTDRREFVRKLGLAALGMALAPKAFAGGSAPVEPVATPSPPPPWASRLPAPAHLLHGAGEPPTEEGAATAYNNFYEFTTDKKRVAELAANFQTNPWQVEVGGRYGKPGSYDMHELLGRMSLEERTYRFRCVERWSMVVPWTGIAMADLLDQFEPDASARFVRFVSFADKKQMPGISEAPWYPWPYHEGLTIREARHPLAFMACGLYGKPLPPQNGAPIRAVIPWKYGYKSIKSIARIEFTENQPSTFWSTIAPSEYPFISNVDPTVPHPRWSQATEYRIPDGKPQPTLPYNGYETLVAHLYS